MSLVLFSGAAGTGKTTSLFHNSIEYLTENSLRDNQRVLALTKYHGSRKRMDFKFNGKEGLGSPVDCFTIDSFAMNLVNRWRSRVHFTGAFPEIGDFHAIMNAAGELLEHNEVGEWVARRYPLILVDELQDCKGGEIKFLSGLELHVHCICAADAFQDLSADKNNQAISWANSVGDVVLLEQVHRTQVRGLLNAAHAIRDSSALESERKTGFEIISVPKAPLGGAITSWTIKSWSNYGRIAVISPTAKENSPFCAGIVEWTSTKISKSRKSKATAGPYRLDWEHSDDDSSKTIMETMNIKDNREEEFSCNDLTRIAREIGEKDIYDWLRREQFIRGRNSITSNEAHRKIKEIVRRRRIYGYSRLKGRIALTIYQAKNREFESVIVLWPLRIQPGTDKQRRLLYNAVTRARRQVVVIVEDPKKERLETSLFLGE